MHNSVTGKFFLENTQCIECTFSLLARYYIRIRWNLRRIHFFMSLANFCIVNSICPCPIWFHKCLKLKHNRKPTKKMFRRTNYNLKIYFKINSFLYFYLKFTSPFSYFTFLSKYFCIFSCFFLHKNFIDII